VNARRGYLRVYQRGWLAKRRAEFMQGKSCIRCGSVERLEIDHVDPATKVDHRVWSWSKERREAELAKCQVLCHACHAEKTARETWGPREHGRISMYSYHGCRCAECRAANARRKRDNALMGPIRDAGARFYWRGRWRGGLA